MTIDYSQRPSHEECVSYHRDYVAAVPSGDILKTLETQIEKIKERIRTLPPEEIEKTHAPYTWTIRQVIEHCVNAERVFGYRIMRFATGDTTDLPGWNENFYAECGFGMNCSIEDLQNEYVAIRRSNIALLKRLQSGCFDRAGLAEGRRTSVRAIAWLIAGHWLHHDRILQKRLAN